MAQVLIVDDDVSFLNSLSDALAAEDYSLRMARDGIEALAALRSEHIDLLVTDVNMPRLDGIQLLQVVLNEHGFIPCLVMTAYGTPELERRATLAGGLDIIHKPIDLPLLKARIRDTLAAQKAASVVRGIPLASFVQLLALERKTCTVKATRVGSGTGGLLFLVEGRLVDAVSGQEEGLEAAYAILSWEPVEIAIQEGHRHPNTRIHESMDAVVLEALRRHDEVVRATAADNPLTRLLGLTKEEVMGLEAHLEEFKGVKGYLAAGIMDFTGEILASHSTTTGVDLTVTGAVFNDIFRSAHEASGKIGLLACRNLVMATPKGTIVMECSGADKQPHVHMIVILEESGNQALAKVTITKVLPKIVADLT